MKVEKNIEISAAAWQDALTFRAAGSGHGSNVAHGRSGAGGAHCDETATSGVDLKPFSVRIFRGTAARNHSAIGRAVLSSGKHWRKILQAPLAVGSPGPADGRWARGWRVPAVRPSGGRSRSRSYPVFLRRPNRSPEIEIIRLRQRDEIGRGFSPGFLLIVFLSFPKILRVSA